MAKYRAEDGRIVMRSTKQKNRGDAMRVALTWEKAAAQARVGELTQASAVKILNEMMLATTGETLKRRSIETVMNDYVATRSSTGKASSTSARYKPIVKSFLSSLSEIRRKAAVASLTVEEIQNWQHAEFASGKSAKTVNMGTAVIRAALEGCRRQGEVLMNVADGVESASGNSEKRQPFTPVEVGLLLGSSVGEYAEWKTAVLFGVCAGLRLGDATSVLWGQVNLAEGYLDVTPDKTDEPVTIALSAQLREHLESLPKKGHNAPLMPKLAGRKTGSNGQNAGLSNEFKRLMTKAGVIPKPGLKKEGKGRQVQKKSFHSLRHTFTSTVVSSGAGDAVTKSMTGHTTDEAFRRYVHLGLEEQRGALKAFPRFVEKVPTPATAP